MKRIFYLFIFLFTVFYAQSQNIAITDDNAYTANNSAMLDIKSLTKGLLIPRMTSVQRTSIVTPATGLLVFDTTLNGFYYYNGTVWINLTSGSSSGLFWSYNSPNIYTSNTGDFVGIGTSTPTGKLTIQGGGINSLFFEYGGIYDAHMGLSGYDLEIYSADDMRLKINEQNSAGTFEIYDQYNSKSWMLIDDGNVGIGTTTPGRKLVVKADATSGLDEAIFAVQNQNGDTVFAVYNEGVRIWVDDNGGTKANGSRGGFAVGGFSPTKAGFTNEYLRVTPDSVRVYINDDYVPAKANGSRGGFAVGGFNPAKGAPSEHYLFVQDDSTRVYVADSLEGFGVENIEAVNDQRIMRLSTQNYFIGHESGVKLTTGEYNSCVGYKSGFNITSANKNSFYGYQAGMSNSTGYENVFNGYQAGKSNTSGFRNVFIGPQAGYSNTSAQFSVFIGYKAGYANTAMNNVFIGNGSGQDNTNGSGNTFLGNQAGFSNVSGGFNTYISMWAGVNMTDGSDNIFIGPLAGYDNVHGNQNVYLGSGSGGNNIGSGNVFLGYQSGQNETGSNKLYIDNSSTSTPLIYGDFTANEVQIHNFLGVAVNPITALHVERSLNANATPSGHVALIKNTSTGTSPDVLCLQVAYTGLASGSINYITFLNGNDVGVGAIEGDGAGGVTYKSGSADFAEFLPKINNDEIISENEVVGVYNGKISKNTQNADRVLVITDRPIVLGNDPGENQESNFEKVSFLGQVPVKVSGIVNVGDYIIASGNNDGTAISKNIDDLNDSDISQIIGIAWESKENSQTDLVLTSIGIDNYKLPIKKLLEENNEQQKLINELLIRIEKLEKTHN